MRPVAVAATDDEALRPVADEPVAALPRQQHAARVVHVGVSVLVFSPSHLSHFKTLLWPVLCSSAMMSSLSSLFPNRNIQLTQRPYVCSYYTIFQPLVYRFRCEEHRNSEKARKSPKLPISQHRKQSSSRSDG